LKPKHNFEYYASGGSIVLLGRCFETVGPYTIASKINHVCKGSEREQESSSNNSLEDENARTGVNKKD